MKRHRLVEWIKTQEVSTCCLKEMHLTKEDRHRLIVKNWKSIFYANRNPKKAGIMLLILDKIDFKTKTVTNNKEEHIC